MALGRLYADIAKIFAAALGMGLVVAAGWWGLCRGHGLLGDLLALLLVIPAGALIYGGLLILLRVGGLEEFLALWHKFRAKLGLPGKR
jgi:hypothetical protein